MPQAMEQGDHSPFSSVGKFCPLGTFVARKEIRTLLDLIARHGDERLDCRSIPRRAKVPNPTNQSRTRNAESLLTFAPVELTGERKCRTTTE